MRFATRIRSLVGTPEGEREPRIAAFGDSHSAALKRASDFARRKHAYEHIRVVRLRKEKNGKSIGDAELSDFCREISRFGPSDFVFSLVGGNQYAVVSTVRGTLEYDFLTSPGDEELASDHGEIVPFRAIAGYIRDGVRGTIGPVLQQIRQSTAAKVFHVAPPPPKADNAFITRHFEGRFADDGLQDLGATRPELRLKCWNVQLQFLRELCKELEVGLLTPPAKAVTPEGYLKPSCYANDVTHANRRYGELVLRQISKVTGTMSFVDGEPQ